MTGREWTRAFAASLGVDPPDDADIDLLLALAGKAAHESERTAAPIACYLVGMSGKDIRHAIELANGMFESTSAPD